MLCEDKKEHREEQAVGALREETGSHRIVDSISTFGSAVSLWRWALTQIPGQFRLGMILQLEIQSDGQALINRLYQQFREEHDDRTAEVLAKRKLGFDAIRKRWHNLYLNSLCLQCRIEEAINRFQEFVLFCFVCIRHNNPERIHENLKVSEPNKLRIYYIHHKLFIDEKGYGAVSSINIHLLHVILPAILLAGSRQI
ncbi:hypothetical protein ANCCEY_05976 [Ancylostoma ceylanicum]|uniref:Uncharacterized protein n=1 Tax=Ancylostoma ceylanicum TaxID=53326 RepID=A0A0D6LSS6_9BILA|nr:hypothetical protein ANCCEY_05976 [Ancylostoma ceylanicum]